MNAQSITAADIVNQYDAEAQAQRREGRFNLARRYAEIAHALRQRGPAALEHKMFRGLDARDE